uniref:Uncharacterized protein n=1 Tax=Aureoumbra lagunensis TaxID=44058 RepID=A0A7S3JXD2_9STRA|mmetsp:Transcript_943/g.1314  ORF Transcript_943/g.1314 Transcript_943/m.1314 type:complete len:429 (+) Transcript_943:92-1378(+)|eukprot:CAMPEP_0197314506 /NCGR_PEP_ID=MMETSP0891-20130614/34277_1 /TAXON_ID=44058 ORGANISM="Aureoumbra lagunensis, Strain CCMP1510" /NCGR_SAMPLE_ID=MMETSP0891 /ASSEMBLY_ACC=CAM_ASM_000534 /LENGTH=428 /DNA_ID=CAMNT_0042802989 /DNA_START=35 /DNA_END=1321 /DNA_ORIENTATION=+
MILFIVFILAAVHAEDFCCVIDFEGLESGTIVNELELGEGYNCNNGDIGKIIVFASRAQDTSDTSSNNAAMIFDSANPTGGDFDLSSDLGKILIISEDFDSTDPDDNARGGIITMQFDQLIDLKEMILLDAEEPSPDLLLFYADESSSESIELPTSPGNGESIQINLTQTNYSMQDIQSIQLTFPRSAALASLIVCASSNENQITAGEQNIISSIATTNNEEDYHVCCQVDFEGLETGSLVNKLYQQFGYSCPMGTIGNFIRDWGFRFQDLQAVNPIKREHALMIYDNTNPNFPHINKTLIISKDFDTSNPDHNAQGGTIIFDFQKLFDCNHGYVDLMNMTLLDLDDNQNNQDIAKLKLFYEDLSSTTIELPSTTSLDNQSMFLDFTQMTTSATASFVNVYKFRLMFPYSVTLGGFSFCCSNTTIEEE